MNKREAKKILNEALGYGFEHGSETLYKCPKCNHHKSKLSVNLSKNVFKCWICDYRGRSLRRLIRSFGSYTQLQKWDQVTDRVDIERFADLFMERVVEEREERLELPPEFLTLTGTKPPATAQFAHRYLRERGVTNEDLSLIHI